ncbi:hypothetical protein FB567DRAFT_554613 [Paraphoma chrysanthemicola]|uniref:Uncharacterized protein n=1 Tax=Paraphoma chrysanthemicola TaxID=798071 RepID=A0A8K0VT41_9PLEO|nr:hypothetical protein FB567DRAFT_554613 [Paraphoma chrysanthemicola]
MSMHVHVIPEPHLSAVRSMKAGGWVWRREWFGDEDGDGDEDGEGDEDNDGDRPAKHTWKACLVEYQQVVGLPLACQLVYCLFRGRDLGVLKREVARHEIVAIEAEAKGVLGGNAVDGDRGFEEHCELLSPLKRVDRRRGGCEADPRRGRPGGEVWRIGARLRAGKDDGSGGAGRRASRARARAYEGTATVRCTDECTQAGTAKPGMMMETGVVADDGREANTKAGVDSRRLQNCRGTIHRLALRNHVISPPNSCHLTRTTEEEESARRQRQSLAVLPCLVEWHFVAPNSSWEPYISRIDVDIGERYDGHHIHAPQSNIAVRHHKIGAAFEVQVLLPFTSQFEWVRYVPLCGCFFGAQREDCVIVTTTATTANGLIACSASSIQSR